MEGDEGEDRTGGDYSNDEGSGQEEDDDYYDDEADRRGEKSIISPLSQPQSSGALLNVHNANKSSVNMNRKTPAGDVPSSSPATNTATTTTNAEDDGDILAEVPRTEALIGIRPYNSEGSGGGRGMSDDDDDDDDFDDDDDDTTNTKNTRNYKNVRENVEKYSDSHRRFNNHNGNLEDGSRDDDDSNRFMKNRRLGKNNAIKFISTPHGKVGILYSSSDEKKTNEHSSSTSSHAADSGKNSFRGISSDLRPIMMSENTNNVASSASGGKITPVLTADGKVALLYRSVAVSNENVAKKYEPIMNFTKNEVSRPEEPAISSGFSNSFDKLSPHVPKIHQREEIAPDPPPPPSIGETLPEAPIFKPDIREDDMEDARAPPEVEDNHFLPILDRPLSELLGLKKHQFTHIRVTEPATTTSIPQINLRGKLPLNYDYDFGLEYNGINDQEVLTRTEVVNLAIVPSSMHEQNARLRKGDRHGRHRIRIEDLSNVHCAMQAMVAFAALACIFGMLGAYFKNRILDQVPTYRL